MRTNIVIDDTLMSKAMHLSGLHTKKEVVEESLKLFVRMRQQEQVKDYFGKLAWEGDLDAMREDPDVDGR